MTDDLLKATTDAGFPSDEPLKRSARRRAMIAMANAVDHIEYQPGWRPTDEAFVLTVYIEEDYFPPAKRLRLVGRKGDRREEEVEIEEVEMRYDLYVEIAVIPTTYGGYIFRASHLPEAPWQMHYTNETHVSFDNQTPRALAEFMSEQAEDCKRFFDERLMHAT